MFAARSLIQRRHAARCIPGRVVYGLATAADTVKHAHVDHQTTVTEQKARTDHAGTEANPRNQAVLMEPNTLCKSLVQDAKRNTRNKKTWIMHLKRALQLKKQLNIKHIAIIVHSCSTAKIDKTHMQTLLDGLAETIMTHLSKRHATIDTEARKVELYNIYSLLYGAMNAEYNNTKLINALKDNAVAQFRNILKQDILQQLYPFIFEDLAGIVHALAQLQVNMEMHEVEMIAKLFNKLYISDRNATKTMAHRTFAIILNALERLECRNTQLCQLAKHHIQQHLTEMHNIKDIAMIYCSIIRMQNHIYDKQTNDEQQLIPQGIGDVQTAMQPHDHTAAPDASDSGRIGSAIMIATEDHPNPYVDDTSTITSMILERVVDAGLILGSMESDAQSVANIVAYAAPYAEIGHEQLKRHYDTFMTQAVTQVMQKADVDHTSLVHLMKHAIRRNNMDNALVMLTARNINTVGMIAGPLEFAQHITNISNIMQKYRGSKLTNTLTQIAISNMLHFENRMAMPQFTLKQRPKRQRTLCDIIQSAKQKDAKTETICVHNELYNHFRGDDAMYYCSKTIVAISEYNTHKTAVDLAQRILDILARICHTQTDKMDMESIAAVVTGMYRFRMKNEHVLRCMADKVTQQICGSPNSHTLVQIILAYAKLGCPKNRDVNRGLISSNGVNRTCKSALWKNTQVTYQNMLHKVLQAVITQDTITQINAQTTVNAIFAIVIAGIGKRVPSILYKLLSRFLQIYRNTDHCIQMEKQVQTSLIVLKQVFRRGNCLVRQQIKRLQKNKTNTVSHEHGTSTHGHITVAPMKPYSMISGLHRSVWKCIKRNHPKAVVKAEVTCKNKLYHTDILVKKGITKIHIEVDGPTHFFHATQEPLPISKLKHAILKTQGTRIIRAPYYAWQKNIVLLKI